jgi:antitoxin HicB
MEWRFEYPAKIEQDDAGFYLVTFPDFPEAATDCRSREQVLAEATDCLEEAVAGRIKRGDDLPQPSWAEPNSVVVALPALYALKAALYLAAKEARLSQSSLAAKLGKKEREVERLLDPSRPSPTPALEAALRAVGKSVRVTVADTAP